MNKLNRRAFLKSAAITAAALGARRSLLAADAPAIAATRSANSKLNIACIGVGGRGGAHLNAASNENLVALCDIDEGTIKRQLNHVIKYQAEIKSASKAPATFSDYRKMFDKMHKDIDAVVVATPDNHHAIASMMAIKLGKGVYCEKPLSYTIQEARALAQAAREQKVATQMGNQGRADEGWRLLCEVMWSGVIGNVKEAHIWTDRPGTARKLWWPSGGERPAYTDPVPQSVNWDCWLGPAPERPFVLNYRDGKFKGKRVYHDFVWRGWRDFGTGSMGDIGCHAMSGMFTALKIEHAAAVELVKDSGDLTQEMFPSSSIIRWEIPARKDQPPCQVFWYDGGYLPSHELLEAPKDRELPDNGHLFIGEKGKLVWHGGGPRLIPESKMKDFKKPPQTLPRCAMMGQVDAHQKEWIAACKGGPAAASNFDHAGPLTEMVLLGNLAVFAGTGKKVEWDGPNMKVTNLTDLNRYVRREYRKGWTL